MHPRNHDKTPQDDPDSAYVAKIRRSLALRRRWRLPLLVFWALCFTALIGILVGAIHVVEGVGNMAGNAPNTWAGFAIGVILGVLIGTLSWKIAHSLVDSIRTPRCERLMVQYHDALEDLRREAKEDGRRR